MTMSKASKPDGRSRSEVVVAVESAATTIGEARNHGDQRRHGDALRVLALNAVVV